MLEIGKRYGSAFCGFLKSTGHILFIMLIAFELYNDAISVEVKVFEFYHGDGFFPVRASVFNAGDLHRGFCKVDCERVRCIFLSRVFSQVREIKREAIISVLIKCDRCIMTVP